MKQSYATKAYAAQDYVTERDAICGMILWGGETWKRSV
jgi:hypothetical protein